MDWLKYLFILIKYPFIVNNIEVILTRYVFYSDKLNKLFLIQFNISFLPQIDKRTL